MAGQNPTAPDVASPAQPKRKTTRALSPAPAPATGLPVAATGTQSGDGQGIVLDEAVRKDRAAMGFLGAFIVCRHFHVITLSMSRTGPHKGHSFVAETLLFFPLLAQSVLYLGLLVREKGFQQARHETQAAIPHLRPCRVYSIFTGSALICAVSAQGYLDGSSVVVIQQTCILFIALFETMISKVYPTAKLMAFIVWQVAQVFMFQWLDMTKATQLVQRGKAAGIIFCLVAVVCSACGSVLQQRYLQTQAMSVPLNVKLLWQNLFSLGVVFVTLAVKFALEMDNTHQLLTTGFFGGWTIWAYAHTLVSWGFFFIGTAAVSQGCAVSSMKVQAASLMVISFEAVLELRDPLDEVQWFLVLGMVANAWIFDDAKSRVKTA